MNKYIMLIDMNNYYLSVTAAHMVFNGSTLDIRNKVAVIGGDGVSNRGIVLAKSQQARKYGITTGMSLMDAKTQYQDLIVFPPNYSLYMASNKIFNDILREFSPLVQSYSIDESFIEISDNGNPSFSYMEIAKTIQLRIKEELGITCNIGISKCKILAKMGAGLKKPNMIHTLFSDEVESKMWPLPISKLFGVGLKTEKKLTDLGILTIGDLANADDAMLTYHLKSYAGVIQNHARGIDSTPVRKLNWKPVRGFSNNTTLSFVVKTRVEALRVLLSLTETVTMRLRGSSMCAMVVAITLTNTNFVSKSHQCKINVATDSTQYIYQTSINLYDHIASNHLFTDGIRKFGIRVSELCDNSFVQLSYLETFDFDRAAKLDRALDEIRFRFGSSSVKRATFLHSGISHMSGGVGAENYPVMSNTF